MNGKENWKKWHTFWFLVIVVLMLVAGLYMPARNRFLAWIILLGLLLLSCLIAGHGVTGLLRGLLIDERNKISLSRLQLISWTVVLLSGFLAATFSNILAKSSDPLAISIPEQMWILMGISITSLVGSPLIRSTKMKKEPNQHIIKAYSNQMNLSQDEKKKISRKGLILCNKSYDESKWSDLFEGEGIDSAPLDLGKIQMFFFTLILILVYIVNLGLLFLSDKSIIDEFPSISSSFIALLAISHGGYLIDKAVPRS